MDTCFFIKKGDKILYTIYTKILIKSNQEFYQQLWTVFFYLLILEIATHRLITVFPSIPANLIIKIADFFLVFHTKKFFFNNFIRII